MAKRINSNRHGCMKPETPGVPRVLEWRPREGHWKQGSAASSGLLTGRVQWAPIEFSSLCVSSGLLGILFFLVVVTSVSVPRRNCAHHALVACAVVFAAPATHALFAENLRCTLGTGEIPMSQTFLPRGGPKLHPAFPPLCSYSQASVVCKVCVRCVASGSLLSAASRCPYRADQVPTNQYSARGWVRVWVESRWCYLGNPHLGTGVCVFLWTPPVVGPPRLTSPQGQGCILPPPREHPRTRSGTPSPTLSDVIPASAHPGQRPARPPAACSWSASTSQIVSTPHQRCKNVGGGKRCAPPCSGGRSRCRHLKQDLLYSENCPSCPPRGDREGRGD